MHSFTSGRWSVTGALLGCNIGFEIPLDTSASILKLWEESGQRGIRQYYKTLAVSWKYRQKKDVTRIRRLFSHPPRCPSSAHCSIRHHMELLNYDLFVFIGRNRRLKTKPVRAQWRRRMINARLKYGILSSRHKGNHAESESDSRGHSGRRNLDCTERTRFNTQNPRRSGKSCRFIHTSTDGTSSGTLAALLVLSSALLVLPLAILATSLALAFDFAPWPLAVVVYAIVQLWTR